MKRMVLSCVCLLLAVSPAWAQITVTGEGTVSAVPDMATVVLAVATEDVQATVALDSNSTTMYSLVKSLQALGVTKKELRTNMFQVSPKFVYPKDGSTPRLVGYVVTNSLTVTICQTGTLEERLGKVLDSVVKGGARVESVSWGFQDPQKLLDAARVSAVKDARRKAELMANTAGSTLGTLVSISESVSYRQNVGYTMRSADSAPSAPVEAGQQTLRATVSVVWSVGPLTK